MLENIYEGENALSEVYLSKEYFCEMYQTCVSSKLCEFIGHLSGSRGSIWMDVKDEQQNILGNESRRMIGMSNLSGEYYCK